MASEPKPIPALKTCAPTGTTTSFACPGFVPIEIPKHDISEGAWRFRAARQAADLTLRQAAARLGLEVVVVSGLEWGRWAPENEADWDTLCTRLANTALIVQCGPPCNYMVKEGTVCTKCGRYKEPSHAD